MKNAMKVFCACLLLAFGIGAMGCLTLRAIDKTVANDELYGWRSDGAGHAYRNIDIRKSGG